jgi:hypothetical protein
MSDRKQSGTQDARSLRRARELRLNLKRRKAQARARADRASPGTPHDSAGIVREIAPDKPKG